MGFNYLENQFNCSNLFIDEKYLELNYIPDTIMHREQELILLSKNFIKLLESPFSISRKILIQGNVGIGKTMITRIFGQMLKLSAEKRKLPLKFIHINCRKEKTSYKILYQILSQLDCKVPKRGFSPQELFTILHDFLRSKQYYLILVLDELNHLKTLNFDLIYSLTRLNDDNIDEKNYISLITIVRDITLLKNLDNSTSSSLQGNIISLKKYNKSQIYDILKQRANLAIKKDVFSDEIIEFIADNISDSGDIRKGLNIIRNSVKIVESNQKNSVEFDDIDAAISNTIPSIQDDALDTLNIHQKLLLYSICNLTTEFGKSWFSNAQIRDKYIQLCEKIHDTPRKNTQLWQYLHTLKTSSLIRIKTNSKNQKGRSSFYKLCPIPINLLQKKLDKIFYM